MPIIFCPECGDEPRCAQTYEVGSSDIIGAPHEYQTRYTQHELAQQELDLLKKIEALRQLHAAGSKVRFIQSKTSYYDYDDIQWAEVVCHLNNGKIRLLRDGVTFDLDAKYVYQVRNHY